jgi:hypothetical protein
MRRRLFLARGRRSRTRRRRSWLGGRWSSLARGSTQTSEQQLAKRFSISRKGRLKLRASSLESRRSCSCEWRLWLRNRLRRPAVAYASRPRDPLGRRAPPLRLPGQPPRPASCRSVALWFRLARSSTGPGRGCGAGTGTASRLLPTRGDLPSSRTRTRRFMTSRTSMTALPDSECTPLVSGRFTHRKGARFCMRPNGLRLGSSRAPALRLATHQSRALSRLA